MKKLLTLLLLLPCVTFAQWRASISAGVSFNSAPYYKYVYDGLDHGKLYPKFYANASFTNTSKGWIYGINANSFQVSYSDSRSSFLFSDNTKESKSTRFLMNVSNESFGAYDAKVGSSIIGIGLTGGRQFSCKNFDIPARLVVSYLIPMGNYSIVNQGRKFESDGIGSGFSLGLSFGGNIHLTKNLGALVELQPTYYMMDKATIKGFIIPASVGVSYTF